MQFLPDFPVFLKVGALLVGLLVSELQGVVEQSSFSESEPSELIRDTSVMTSGATDRERCSTFCFESKCKSLTFIKLSSGSLSQVIVRAFNLRRLDLRLFAKNDPLEFSSKPRTGADIARTKGGRFCMVREGEALKLLEVGEPLVVVFELLTALWQFVVLALVNTDCFVV